MWRFDIAHLPGSTNTAADAASRHPATSEFFATISGAERDSIDSLEEAFLASLRQNTRDELTLNWDEIARHTASDAALNDLLSAIQSNFDVNCPPKGGIRQYLPYRDGFYISDGVILYNDRVVIPPQLRHQVLCTLHAAHQGVSAMERRARATVPWPAGTTVTGANALVRLLRSYFATFGMPEEISSDGGPEFTALSHRILCASGTSNTASLPPTSPNPTAARRLQSKPLKDFSCQY